MMPNDMLSFVKKKVSIVLLQRNVLLRVRFTFIHLVMAYTISHAASITCQDSCRVFYSVFSWIKTVMIKKYSPMDVPFSVHVFKCTSVYISRGLATSRKCSELD